MKSENTENLQAAASQLVDMNDARPRRWGWMVLLLGFGGFFLWASLAPLDQGVPSTGMVVVSGSRKSVQPLVSGKVAAILAKDGDEVKKDQVLIRLDDTQARSQLDISKSQLFTALAVEARLMAERDGKGQIQFPARLVAEKGDVRAANVMALQKQLFDTRRQTLRSEQSVLQESIAGLEAQAKGLEESKKAKDEQLRLLKEEIRGQRELANEGYLPRNRLLEQERLLAQLSGAISEDIGNVGRTLRGISEIKARMLAQQQTFSKEVESTLTDVQKEAASLSSRVDALEFELANTEIRSPADGVVVGLAMHTVGGVAQAGSVLMDVVPKNEPLKIDTQIPTHLIDKLKPGLEVDILFPAFQQSITPHVPGKVVNVSADALIEPKQGMPYFKALVEVTPEGMHNLRHHQIRAGMPAEVFVKTGERTMMNYLIKPLTDRLRTSLTEE